MLTAWRRLSSVTKAATVFLAASAGGIVISRLASVRDPVGFRPSIMSWQAHGKIYPDF